MRAADAVDRRDVDAGDALRLHVVLSGMGPPLMLLHGFTGSSETWTPVRALLDPDHRVIAVDLPGHGRSSAPDAPGRYALERLADDLAGVLDTLGVGRVSVLGYSLGGRAAIWFALRHPNRLAALLLESTSAGIAEPAARAERARADEALANDIEREGIHAFVDRWERLPLWESQRSLSVGARGHLRAQREANVPRGLANSLRGAGAGVTPPVLDRLIDISAPVLLIAGALDVPYVAHARQMEQAFPHARCIIVRNAGHAVHLEQLDIFGAEVGAFLEEHA